MTALDTLLQPIRAALGALPEMMRLPWVQLDGEPYLSATADPNALPWQVPIVGRFDCLPAMPYVAALHPATMTALLEQVDALRRDAERWRFLRDCDPDAGYPVPLRHEQNDWGNWRYVFVQTDELDAAIDAAITERAAMSAKEQTDAASIADHVLPK